MLALQEFLGMVPHLTEASGGDSAGSVLAGCERDTKHLALKALTLLHQVWCEQAVQVTSAVGLLRHLACAAVPGQAECA